MLWKNDSDRRYHLRNFIVYFRKGYNEMAKIGSEKNELFEFAISSASELQGSRMSSSEIVGTNALILTPTCERRFYAHIQSMIVSSVSAHFFFSHFTMALLILTFVINRKFEV